MKTALSLLLLLSSITNGLAFQALVPLSRVSQSALFSAPLAVEETATADKTEAKALTRDRYIATNRKSWDVVAV